MGQGRFRPVREHVVDHHQRAAGPAGPVAVTGDGAHVLVVPVVQDLAQHVQVAGLDLAQEVADHELDAAGDAARGQEFGRPGQRLGAVHQHPVRGREGSEQIGQERPAAAAHIDDAAGGQRPETGLGALVHQDAGDPAHSLDEPGRLLATARSTS